MSTIAMLAEEARLTYLGAEEQLHILQDQARMGRARRSPEALARLQERLITKRRIAEALELLAANPEALPATLLAQIEGER